jgi:hypothetical protein
MNNAIKLAVEKGGYDTPSTKIITLQGRRYGLNTINKWYQAYVMTDPLFWQALGKALGWSKELYKDNPFDGTAIWQTWQYHAHQYFDLVLTGGDTEKFWKSLIK